MSDDDVQYDHQSEQAPPEAEIALNNERALRALRAKQRFQVAAIDLVDTQPGSVDEQPAVPVTPVVARAVADLAYDYAETLAMDLMHFAQHAKRGTVAVSDVLLAVHDRLQQQAQELVEKKRKNKAPTIED